MHVEAIYIIHAHTYLERELKKRSGHMRPEKNTRQDTTSLVTTRSREKITARYADIVMHVEVIYYRSSSARLTSPLIRITKAYTYIKSIPAICVSMCVPT